MKQTICLISFLVLFSVMFGATPISENIQSWYPRPDFGAWTQTISAGTVTLADCRVEPSAVGVGVCSPGRIYLNGAASTLQLPTLSSVGSIEFNLASITPAQTVKLQYYNGSTWVDMFTYTGINSGGVHFQTFFGLTSPYTMRLAQASSTVFVHDIIITDYVLLINENIQNWTAHLAYGNWTQSIPDGTVTMTDCIVDPTAAASGQGSAGRVELNAITGIMQLQSLSSAGSIKFYLAARTAGSTVKLQVYFLSSWVDFTLFTSIGTSAATYSLYWNAPTPPPMRLAQGSSDIFVHDIKIAVYADPVPFILLEPASQTRFNYICGNGPSSEQTFIASGTNLGDDISISAPADYEISQSSGSGYANPLTLNQTEGSVAVTSVYVRLKAGLNPGMYNNETITASSNGATNKTVSCSGYVVGEELISESFTMDLPAQWSTTGPSEMNWMWSDTDYAGGIAGEMIFSNLSFGTGVYRYISPAFDTRKVHDMTLLFRHAFNYGSGSVSLAVCISTDLTNWTNVWEATPGGNIPAAQVCVSIPFYRGMSATTYIAIEFDGDPSLIDGWMIDDVSLSYFNTLGYGTWAQDDYSPVGNLIIPNGYTLQLEAGTNVYFAAGTNLTMDGRLLVNGTESQPVRFTSSSELQDWKGLKCNTVNPANDSTLINYAIVELSNESGITVQSTNKLRISHSFLRFNAHNSGAGIKCTSGNIIVENCEFYANVSSQNGAAMCFQNCTPIIRNNLIYNNQSTNGTGSTLLFVSCDVSQVIFNQISANYLLSGCYSVYLFTSSGIFQRNMVCNNQASGIYNFMGSVIIANCDIINNSEGGIEFYTVGSSITNSIIYGNTSFGIYNSYADVMAVTVSYCCIQGGFSAVYGINSSCYIHNITADPLFVNPSSGSGISDWGLDTDWHLQDLSPSIDAGNPASPLNPDLSFEDIGVYYRMLKPIITRALDVPFDQGHWLDLRWSRNDLDVTFDPEAVYYALGTGTSRSGKVTWVTNLAQLPPDTDFSAQSFGWRDGDRTWYLLGSYPALNFDEYGLIVPTVQDSSFSGTHAAQYVIVFRNGTGQWISVSQSGYSVDNIPPYAPGRVNITHVTGNQFNLEWDEVTEGGWEGNSYPEANLISYKVYAGDSPDFVISPATFLMSTTNPNAVLNNQTADKKFYKIIATDSE